MSKDRPSLVDPAPYIAEYISKTPEQIDVTCSIVA